MDKTPRRQWMLHGFTQFSLNACAFKPRGTCPARPCKTQQKDHWERFPNSKNVIGVGQTSHQFKKIVSNLSSYCQFFFWKKKKIWQLCVHFDWQVHVVIWKITLMSLKRKTVRLGKSQAKGQFSGVNCCLSHACNSFTTESKKSQLGGIRAQFQVSYEHFQFRLE